MQAERAGEVSIVRLRGEIDETFDRRAFLEGFGRLTVVDLDAVRSVTSFGVKEWLAAMRQVPTSAYVCFINARPSVAMQFNLVAGFAGHGELVSVYAPFVCPSTGEERHVLLDLRRDYSLLASHVLEEPECHPGERAEFDDIFETYFSYVISRPPPTVPSAISQLLDGAAAPTKAAFGVDKDVFEDVTALRLRGSLTGRTRLKRVLEGIEGAVLVLLDDLDELEPEGAAQLAPLLDAGDTADVAFARVPYAFIEPLLQALPGARKRLISVLLDVVDLEGAPGRIEVLARDLPQLEAGTVTSPVSGLAVAAADQARGAALRSLLRPASGVFEAYFQRRGAPPARSGASQFLNALVGGIPTPFYVLDEERTLIITNDAFCRLVGLHRYELIGARLEDVLPRAMAESLCAGDEAAFAEGRASVSELSVELVAGATQHYLVHRALMEIDEGEVLVSVVFDITSQKVLEARLVAAREAALAATRAKSQFLANMSHEIRTPLNGVLGTLGLLREAKLDPDSRECVEVAHGSAQLLLSLLNDVLDFSKVEAGHMTLEDLPYDPRALVSGLVKLNEPVARSKGLELVARVAEDVPQTLRGDQLRLRQILGNLLSNAIKFTSVGRVEVGVAVGEGKLCYHVRDTGIGIPRAVQEAIFEPFAQAESSITRRFGGTGLGLAISRHLTALMEGSIGLESEPGQGSRFTVELPLRMDSPAQAVEGAESLQVQAPRGLRVLVVDDNSVNRLVATKMLQRLGHAAQSASDGHAALREASAGELDVILMDVQMPEFDGLDAARAIREMERSEGRPRLPIVALTAHASAGDAERCREAGMDDYLTKPLALEGLAGVLSRLSSAGPSTARGPSEGA